MSVNRSDIIQERQLWLKMLECDYTVEMGIPETFVYEHKSCVLEELKSNVRLPDTEVRNNTKVSVYHQDIRKSIFAACSHASAGKRICVLNFASYYNPGGGFLSGAVSQEESLCSVSGLYPLLKDQQSVYNKRKGLKCNSLYLDDMIYCKDVPFIQKPFGKAVYADVLTVAAPNLRALDDKSVTQDEIDKCLDRRMELIYLLPAYHGCSIVLLGAWGCGVFGNDAKSIAYKWDYLTREKYDGLYYEVCHPVLDDKQYKIFSQICR